MQIHAWGILHRGKYTGLHLLGIWAVFGDHMYDMIWERETDASCPAERGKSEVAQMVRSRLRWGLA